MQPPGRRVEHGDPPFGVTRHDALLEGVQQDLEELLLAAELGRRLAGGGDVAEGRHRPGDRAPGVDHGLSVGPDPQGRPPLAPHPEYHADGAPAGPEAGHDRVVVGPEGTTVGVHHLEVAGRSTGQEVLEMPTEEPHPGRLEHHFERLVHPHDDADRVDHHDAVGQGLHQGRLAVVHVADPLFEPLALGDVADVDHDAADRVVEMVGRHYVEVDRRAIGPDRLHLEGHRQAPPRHQVPEECPDRLHAQRVEQGEGVHADHVADVIAQQPFRRRAHEDEAALRADHGDHVEFVLVEIVEPGLVHRSRAFRRGEVRHRSRRHLAAGGRPVQHHGGPEVLELGRTGDRPTLGPAHGAPTGRSAVHSGWNTCHCSGARRISPSKRVAISWVSRATSDRSDPCRVVSRGGWITAR